VEMIAKRELNEVINDLVQHFKNKIQNDRDKECQVYNHIQLAECYLLQGKDNKALKTLYDTFMLSEPRPTVCYKIASIYFDQKKYDQAHSWLEIAVNAEFNYNTLAKMAP